MESIFAVEESKIRCIRPGDKNFKIQGPILQSDRASIEISPSCPNHYAQLILECYNRGWIKPVAYVTERELIFMGLSND